MFSLSIQEALARDFVVLLPFVKVKGEKLRHNGVDVLRAVDTRVLLYQGQDMLAMVLLAPEKCCQFNLCFCFQPIPYPNTSIHILYIYIYFFLIYL